MERRVRERRVGRMLVFMYKEKDSDIYDIYDIDAIEMHIYGSMVIPESIVRAMLKRGNKILNLELSEDGEIKYSGSIDKYSRPHFGILVLAKIHNQYVIVENGKLNKVYIGYLQDNVLINAKVGFINHKYIVMLKRGQLPDYTAEVSQEITESDGIEDKELKTENRLVINPQKQQEKGKEKESEGESKKESFNTLNFMNKLTKIFDKKGK